MSKIKPKSVTKLPIEFGKRKTALVQEYYEGKFTKTDILSRGNN